MKAKIDTWLGHVLVGLMALMTLDVLWGVFTRYALGSQASWTEELARFLLIWIGTLGAAYASGQRMHLAIELLEPSMNDQNAAILRKLIAGLVILFVLAVMVIGGARLIYITAYLEQASPAMQVPMGLVYSIIPVSGLLIVYYKMVELLGPQS
jgi:TRAP-type C4-dicarboxylate transport system permease small subunit